MSKLLVTVKQVTSDTEPGAFSSIRSNDVTWEFEHFDNDQNEVFTIECPDELLSYVETMLNGSDGVISYTVES